MSSSRMIKRFEQVMSPAVAISFCRAGEKFFFKNQLLFQFQSKITGSQTYKINLLISQKIYIPMTYNIIFLQSVPSRKPDT